MTLVAPSPLSLNWLNLAQQAEARIRPYVPPTPLLKSSALSERFERDVFLKLESRNPTGAYKVRPAFNAILAQLDNARSRGVLTTSSGNFAQAVAYAAKKLGVRACIVMTSDTSPYKIERTRELGAEIVFCGPDFDSRFETVKRLERERGALVLHGFDSIETIAGDGTIALELLNQLDTTLPFSVIVPVSGGGMISGIAATLRQISTDHEVLGAQPSQGGSMAKSIHAGQRVHVGKIHTIADALVASTPGERTFEITRNWAPQVSLVSEKQIHEALLHCLETEKIWAEPGGAVSIAALLSESLPLSKNKPVVCIISGGNADPRILHEILGK